MTVELVTGHAGTGHIDSFDVGGLIAGVAGSGDYVLEEPYGTLDCTVQDNNHVQIGKGDLLINGRHVRIEDPETLTVTSGTQGQQRHDLVVMHYSRQSSGVEDAELQVLRGTPGSSGTPGYGTGSILDGATARDMPLYRLDLDGISLSTSPARLFDTLKPVSAITSDMHQQMQSMTAIRSMEWQPPFTGSTVTLMRSGNLVMVNGFVDSWSRSGWHDASYKPVETIPQGFRPSVDNAVILVHTTNHMGDQTVFEVHRDGSLGLRGKTDDMEHTAVMGGWPTADTMPAA